MPRPRRILTYALAALVLMDAVALRVVMTHGAPITLTRIAQEHDQITFVVRHTPPSSLDFILLGVVLVVHAVLLYLRWALRSRKVAAAE